MAVLRGIAALAVALTVAGCGAAQPTPPPAASSPAVPTSPSPSPPTEDLAGTPFAVQELGSFDEPWAMTFLPGGSDALITLRGGRLVLRQADGSRLDVAGVPEVVHQGQGGLGDVIVGPGFATDRTVYLSWAARGDGGSGAEVARASLVVEAGAARLDDLTVIWRQQPKTSGSGHYGHRLAFSPDGAHLFITSGERQKMTPAQDRSNTLGTIVRTDPDGSNARIWTYGHRNPLGIAFDADGNLWSSEMGPQGGDELNLIVEDRNYGWPRVSNGSHYGGGAIPDHAAGDGFEAPKVWWNPSVSPGSLMIYSGSQFPQWAGDAFIGALSGQALIRVDLDGTKAGKGDEWDFGVRVREVEQAPDGSIWVLTDGDGGRLLRLTPRR
jgi:aldose sugar dehydrogenase